MTPTLHSALTRPCLGLAVAAMAILPGFAASAAASAATGGRPLSATLSGPVEVPPGDLDGTGAFKATVNVGQGQICYDLSVGAIDAPTMAHIHRAAPGSAGPVVVPLNTPTGGSAKACATISKALAKELIQTPGAFYVNVHNAAHPGGAVRGQLSK